MNALNREFVKFKNGATIRFKARSKGGGRGFSCDCLLLDEAQILRPAAWSAILPDDVGPAEPAGLAARHAADRRG